MIAASKPIVQMTLRCFRFFLIKRRAVMGFLPTLAIGAVTDSGAFFGFARFESKSIFDESES